MDKEVKIDGGVYSVDGEIDIELFSEEFYKFLEDRGLAFGGTIREFTEDEKNN